MPKSKLKVDEIMLVLIVALAAMFVGIYRQSNDSGVTEAEKIIGMIFSNNQFGFAANGIIDNSKLDRIQIMNYRDFKHVLDAKKDFCIYIQDGLGDILL